MSMCSRIPGQRRIWLPIWRCSNRGILYWVCHLAHGGHLTHGHKVNFSGKIFQSFSYGVDRERETLDYDAIQRQAEECRPRMIVVGASAYSRTH